MFKAGVTDQNKNNEEEPQLSLRLFSCFDADAFYNVLYNGTMNC